VREFVQRLGRILRRGEGKQAVLYEVIARETREERVAERRRTATVHGRHGRHGQDEKDEEDGKDGNTLIGRVKEPVSQRLLWDDSQS